VAAKNGVTISSGLTVDTTTRPDHDLPAPLIGDTITAGCQFDIPCRFNSAIEVTSIDVAIRDCGSIDIIELLAAMKSTVADYRYRVLCLRIVPTSGSPIYLTDHPRDLVMSGHTYLSTAGLRIHRLLWYRGILAGLDRHRGHRRRLGRHPRGGRQRPVRRRSVLRVRYIVGGARRGSGADRRRHLRPGHAAR
jgi:hypothetical protein